MYKCTKYLENYLIGYFSQSYWIFSAVYKHPAVEVNALEPAKVMGPVGLESHSNPIALEPSIKSYKVVAKQTQAKKPTTHEDEKIALVLFLTGGFTIWNIFQSTCHYDFGSETLYDS